MTKESDIAQEIVRELDQLRGDRGNYDAHCTEIAQRFIPPHSNLFQSFGNNQTKGEKRNQELFDSTGAIALGRFAAILDSLLTPRHQTWHRLGVSEPSLNKNRTVRLWFEEANRLLFKYRYAPKANFVSQNQQVYKSLGAYGSGCMFVDRLQSERGLRYRNCHMSEVYWTENHQGIIDTVHRVFNYTARQAYQHFGEKLPEKIKQDKSQNPNREYQFIHCVKPRQDVDIERVDYRGMPFASYYVSIEGKALLSEKGYTSFPYPSSRYEQAPGEVYGRSPAMDVLPAMKTLNAQKKIVLQQGHRTVNPVLLAHDDGVLDSFSLQPGAINYGGVDAQGRPLVHALPIGNVAIGKELMDDERSVINDSFLVTLFQILIESPQMTATEVMERSKEKGILIAPTVGRQQSEYLGPLIERELDLLVEQKLLEPMPQALVEARGEYKIEYDSPLSRAQRAEEVAGAMRSLEMVTNIVNITQDPSLLDFYNWEEAIPEINEIQGVPYRWINSTEAIMAKRQGRAQQAQTEQMIQAAPAAASMIKAVAPKGSRG